MSSRNLIILFFVMLCCLGCGKQQKVHPIYYTDDETDEDAVIKVPYTEYCGVKTIPVKLNGVTLDMIYDTGCSGLHLSLAELRILAKNGALEEDDILDAAYSTIADGSIVKNGVVNIRKIEIGGEDGVTLKNIEASVSLNQDAPVLLGNGVMDECAEVSVDNINKTINFKLK